MKTILLVLCVTVAGIAAEPDAKKKDGPSIPQPIAELKLTNGAVFRNVTIVRYDANQVVLKSHAGTAPLSYSMIPEPLRSTMLAERDRSRTAEKQKAAELSAAANAEAMKRDELARARATFEKENAERIEEAIRKQTLVVGMSREHAVRAWGEPERKNKTGGAYGTTEQWVYSKPSGRVYVYFEHGVVTNWQTSEFRR